MTSGYLNLNLAVRVRVINKATPPLQQNALYQSNDNFVRNFNYELHGFGGIVRK